MDYLHCTLKMYDKHIQLNYNVLCIIIQFGFVFLYNSNNVD